MGRRALVDSKLSNICSPIGVEFVRVGVLAGRKAGRLTVLECFPNPLLYCAALSELHVTNIVYM